MPTDQYLLAGILRIAENVSGDLVIVVVGMLVADRNSRLRERRDGLNWAIAATGSLGGDEEIGLSELGWHIGGERSSPLVARDERLGPSVESSVHGSPGFSP
jgi:hypothetical protein